MKYDLSITKQTFERSPNASKLFIAGVFSFLCSFSYSAHVYSIYHDIIGYIYVYPWHIEYPEHPIIINTVFTLMNTQMLLLYLKIASWLCFIIAAFFLKESYKQKESSFLTAVGFFLALFSLLHYYWGNFFYIDISILWDWGVLSP